MKMLNLATINVIGETKANTIKEFRSLWNVEGQTSNMYLVCSESEEKMWHLLKIWVWVLSSKIGTKTHGVLQIEKENKIGTIRLFIKCN